MSTITEPLDSSTNAAVTAVSPRTLIEGCFTAEGTASLQYVYDLAVELGLPEQTVRLAIRRMERAGELRQEGRGRAGHLVWSEHGATLARSNASLVVFAFAQDAGMAPWDGNWRLYSFNVPEAQRADRDALRNALTKLGAVAFAPGSYLTPHDIRPELALALPERLTTNYLIEAQLSSLLMPGCADTAAIAEKLWPQADTLAAYAALDRELAKVTTKNLRDELAVVSVAVVLAEKLELALRADPLLPTQLRSEPWPPIATRQHFLKCWEQLRALAPTAPIFIEHEEHV